MRWCMLAALVLSLDARSAVAAVAKTGAARIVAAPVVFVRDSTGSYRSSDDSPALAAMLDSVRAEVKRQFRIVKPTLASHRDTILSIAMGYATRPAHVKNGRLHVTLGAGREGVGSYCPGETGPALVLQLTGTLNGGDGRVLRTGAEGIAVRDWPMSTFTGNADGPRCGYIRDADDEQALRTLLSPSTGVPAWRAATRALIDSLAGRKR